MFQRVGMGAKTLKLTGMRVSDILLVSHHITKEH